MKNENERNVLCMLCVMCIVVACYNTPEYNTNGLVCHLTGLKFTI